MGLVAGIARHSRGVLGRDHLREVLGFCRVRLVATHAQHSGIRKLRRHRAGIFGVLRQRSVASLAGDIGVLAFAFRLCLVGVARLAGFVPGELDGPRPDIVHRAGPEVAILAEIARYDGVPYHQERSGAEREQNYYSHQVFCIAQKVLHARPFSNRLPAPLRTYYVF